MRARSSYFWITAPDANAKDRRGNPLLVLAAASDTLPVDSIRALLDRGADVNAEDPQGKTAVDMAEQRGATPVVDFLLKAGAKKGTADPELVWKPQPAGSVRGAVQRTLPLLQRTDSTFLRKSGCVSCHNDSLSAMAVVAARKKGFAVDEQELRDQVKTIATYLDGWRDRAFEGIGIPGGPDTVSYILLGMAAQNFAPNTATDAMARYLKRKQLPEGRWWIFSQRPPLESNDIEVTATSMRALQIYGPKVCQPEYEKSVRAAAAWLAKAQPRTTDERAFQLLGMEWAGADKEAIRKAGRALIGEQRTDGGWAQLPTLASDAYATGQALVALYESGVLSVTDAAYQRGVRFLLNTQFENGSWYVKSRAIAIQPYFESDFPHGRDQWISVAATSWATMALAPATEEPVKRATK
jgi:squalene cyclase